MKFNLNQGIELAEQAVEPWDFVLTIDGVDYPTRPLKVFELATLKRMTEMSEKEQRAFIASLFADPAPDVSKWDEMKLGGAAVAMVSYFAARAKKKSLNLHEQVAAAAAKK